MDKWLSPTITAAVVSLMLVGHASAEITFPATRNAVGPGEYYTLDTFNEWQAECIRDKNSDDYCSVARPIEDLDAGIELYVAITPYIFTYAVPEVDVDIAPAGNVEIAPYSSSRHYAAYSAAITEIDGKPYDGYWCPVTGNEDCQRGPDISREDFNSLIHGKSAIVTIYTRESSPDSYREITRIDLDLSDVPAAVERARLFNAEIYDIDLDYFNEVKRICDLSVAGVQRRISYSFDEDFESDNISLREGMLGGVTGGSCPGYVALAYLTPDLTTAQRSMFCIDYDKERETINGFQLGERDAYLGCKSPSRTACERVNAARGAGIALTSFAAGAVGSAVGAASVTGTTVVMHSSGAAILTGASGYVAGTLGTIGATALGILTAPVTITAATVSVIAVGGAVYVCS